jgi:N-acetyltransferase 10
VSQALALFVKVMRKLSKRLIDIQKEAITAQLPQPPSTGASRIDGGKDNTAANWRPVNMSIQEELDEAGDEVTREMRTKQREMIDSLDLTK